MSDESKKNHPQEVPQELPTSTWPSAKNEGQQNIYSTNSDSFDLYETKYAQTASSVVIEFHLGVAEKSTWPEVVGLTGEEARMKIKEEAPYVTQIYIIPPGSGWTCDYRTDRVRIHTDESGKVRSPPRVGQLQ